MSASSINDSGSRFLTFNNFGKKFDDITNDIGDVLVDQGKQVYSILSSPTKCIKLSLTNLLINSTGGEGGLDHIKAIVYPGMIKANPAHVKETMEKYILHFQANGLSIPDSVNPEKILESLCPKGEFMKQFAVMSNWQSPLAYEIACLPGLIMSIGIGAPVLEELVFRKGLQQVVLKDGVRKVIQKISPDHADLVDSKIYAVCRIVLTSICFALSHDSDFSFLAREAIDQQVYVAFFAGLFFGFLKETDGLSACFCAHMINNIVVVLGSVFIRC